MLQNVYFLAKIGADTAENEQHFAEICQKLATTLRCEGSKYQTEMLRALRDVNVDCNIIGWSRGGRPA